jgi:hypothetical protein
MSLLIGEADEVVGATDDDRDLACRSKGVEGGRLGNPQAALSSESTAFDPCRFAANEREERRSMLDAR